MKFLQSIIAVSLFCFSARAQEYYTNFQEYGDRDGYNTFGSGGKAIKDKKGFLWVGTDNGLYRFDGQNFKGFRHDPADTFSLSSDYTAIIFIEQDGTFWVGNANKGVSIFDPATEKFHRWRNSNSKEIDITKAHVSKILQDRQGRVWFVIFGTGLACLDKKTNSLKMFSFYKGTAGNPPWQSPAFITDIEEDDKHIFWISTQSGLVQFNPGTGSFSIFKDTTQGKEHHGRHTLITNVHIGNDGMIWTGTWGGGIKKFDPQKNSWETYFWDPGHLNNSTKNISLDIIHKGPGELWVATYDGLLVFTITTKKFSRVVSVNSITSDKINCTQLFDDGEGIIWCSGQKRLTKLETKNELFHFTPVPDNPLYGSGTLGCVTFLDDPFHDLLFIGTYHSKGLYTKNTVTGEIINYPAVKKKIYGDNINQFLLDRDQNVWVCSNRGVHLFNTITKQYELLSSSVKNASFLNSSVYAALEDDDGSIWFASTDKGLLRYDKQLNEIKAFIPENDRLPPDYILSLFKDSKGNIWIGYHGRSGIACIGTNRRSIKFFNQSNYKIPEADVASITESKEGNIFFTLYNYGLGEITKPLSGKDSFRLYNRHNGLSSNVVVALVKDKQENLWISTNNGLSTCRTAQMSFQHFTMMDGLRENYSESSLYCDEKGLVYIGYSVGFQTINPDLINRNNEIPPVILHSFRINGKEYKGDINAVNKISLDHDEANFTFEYAALTFKDNDRIKYAYRLKGLDKDWIYADKQHIAAYSLAHGGTYTLQIKASNPQGVWNDQYYELVISVQAPFWETGWFIAVCVLSAGLLVYWLARMRIKMIRRAEERKTYINKSKAEAEMKALRAQMNPHFIFNCMNTIDAYIHKNNTEAASGFLHKFSSLIRLVLENSQYPYISIKKDMEALQLYIELEEQRHDFSFKHEIFLPQEFLEKNYKIPPLLIQPYVENAILHGLRHRENGGGVLKIIFTEEPGQVICVVEDNGIGRTASAAIYSHRQQRHESLGLKVSKERIESLSVVRDFTPGVSITDKPGNTGTIVKLILPKIKESL